MKKYINSEFINTNLNGPNPITLLDEIIDEMKVEKNSKILNIGKHNLLSTLYIANKFSESHVYNLDSDSNVLEDYNIFKEFSITDNITPLYCNSRNTQIFPSQYFDIIISINSFHYIGLQHLELCKIISLLKPNGKLIVIVPGLKEITNNIFPQQLLKYVGNFNFNFYTTTWWNNHLAKTLEFSSIKCKELTSHSKAWDEWLQTSNPKALADRTMMAEENDEFFSSIYISATKA